MSAHPHNNSPNNWTVSTHIDLDVDEGDIDGNNYTDDWDDEYNNDINCDVGGYISESTRESGSNCHKHQRSHDTKLLPNNDVFEDVLDRINTLIINRFNKILTKEFDRNNNSDVRFFCRIFYNAFVESDDDAINRYAIATVIEAYLRITAQLFILDPKSTPFLQLRPVIVPLWKGLAHDMRIHCHMNDDDNDDSHNIIEQAQIHASDHFLRFLCREMAAATTIPLKLLSLELLAEFIRSVGDHFTLSSEESLMIPIIVSQLLLDKKSVVKKTALNMVNPLLIQARIRDTIRFLAVTDSDPEIRRQALFLMFSRGFKESHSGQQDGKPLEALILLQDERDLDALILIGAMNDWEPLVRSMALSLFEEHELKLTPKKTSFNANNRKNAKRCKTISSQHYGDLDNSDGENDVRKINNHNIYRTYGQHFICGYNCPSTKLNYKQKLWILKRGLIDPDEKIVIQTMNIFSKLLTSSNFDLVDFTLYLSSGQSTHPQISPSYSPSGDDIRDYSAQLYDSVLLQVDRNIFSPLDPTANKIWHSFVSRVQTSMTSTWNGVTNNDITGQSSQSESNSDQNARNHKDNPLVISNTAHSDPLALFTHSLNAISAVQSSIYGDLTVVLSYIVCNYSWAITIDDGQRVERLTYNRKRQKPKFGLENSTTNTDMAPSNDKKKSTLPPIQPHSNTVNPTLNNNDSPKNDKNHNVNDNGGESDLFSSSDDDDENDEIDDENKNVKNKRPQSKSLSMKDSATNGHRTTTTVTSEKPKRKRGPRTGLRAYSQRIIPVASIDYHGHHHTNNYLNMKLNKRPFILEIPSFNAKLGRTNALLMTQWNNDQLQNYEGNLAMFIAERYQDDYYVLKTLIESGRGNDTIEIKDRSTSAKDKVASLQNDPTIAKNAANKTGKNDTQLATPNSLLHKYKSDPDAPVLPELCIVEEEYAYTLHNNPSRLKFTNGSKFIQSTPLQGDSIISDSFHYNPGILTSGLFLLWYLLLNSLSGQKNETITTIYENFYTNTTSHPKQFIPLHELKTSIPTLACPGFADPKSAIEMKKGDFLDDLRPDCSQLTIAMQFGSFFTLQSCVSHALLLSFHLNFPSMTNHNVKSLSDRVQELLSTVDFPSHFFPLGLAVLRMLQPIAVIQHYRLIEHKEMGFGMGIDGNSLVGPDGEVIDEEIHLGNGYPFTYTTYCRNLITEYIANGVEWDQFISTDHGLPQPITVEQYLNYENDLHAHQKEKVIRTREPHFQGDQTIHHHPPPLKSSAQLRKFHRQGMFHALSRYNRATEAHDGDSCEKYRKNFNEHRNLYYSNTIVYESRIKRALIIFQDLLLHAPIHSTNSLFDALSDENLVRMGREFLGQKEKDLVKQSGDDDHKDLLIKQLRSSPAFAKHLNSLQLRNSLLIYMSENELSSILVENIFSLLGWAPYIHHPTPSNPIDPQTGLEIYANDFSELPRKLQDLYRLNNSPILINIAPDFYSVDIALMLMRVLTLSATNSTNPQLIQLTLRHLLTFIPATPHWHVPAMGTHGPIRPDQFSTFAAMGYCQVTNASHDAKSVFDLHHSTGLFTTRQLFTSPCGREYINGVVRPIEGTSDQDRLQTNDRTQSQLPNTVNETKVTFLELFNRSQRKYQYFIDEKRGGDGGNNNDSNNNNKEPPQSSTPTNGWTTINSNITHCHDHYPFRRPILRDANAFSHFFIHPVLQLQAIKSMTDILLSIANLIPMTTSQYTLDLLGPKCLHTNQPREGLLGIFDDDDNGLQYHQAMVKEDARDKVFDQRAALAERRKEIINRNQLDMTSSRSSVPNHAKDLNICKHPVISTRHPLPGRLSRTDIDPQLIFSCHYALLGCGQHHLNINNELSRGHLTFGQLEPHLEIEQCIGSLHATMMKFKGSEKNPLFYGATPISVNNPRDDVKLPPDSQSTDGTRGILPVWTGSYQNYTNYGEYFDWVLFDEGSSISHNDERANHEPNSAQSSTFLSQLNTNNNLRCDLDGLLEERNGLWDETDGEESLDFEADILPSHSYSSGEVVGSYEDSIQFRLEQDPSRLSSRNIKQKYIFLQKNRFSALHYATTQILGHVRMILCEYDSDSARYYNLYVAFFAPEERQAQQNPSLTPLAPPLSPLTLSNMFISLNTNGIFHARQQFCDYLLSSDGFSLSPCHFGDAVAVSPLRDHHATMELFSPMGDPNTEVSVGMRQMAQNLADPHTLNRVGQIFQAATIPIRDNRDTKQWVEFRKQNLPSTLIDTYYSYNHGPSSAPLPRESLNNNNNANHQLKNGDGQTGLFFDLFLQDDLMTLYKSTHVNAQRDFTRHTLDGFDGSVHFAKLISLTRQNQAKDHIGKVGDSHRPSTNHLIIEAIREYSFFLASPYESVSYLTHNDANSIQQLLQDRLAHRDFNDNAFSGDTDFITSSHYPSGNTRLSVWKPNLGFASNLRNEIKSDYDQYITKFREDKHRKWLKATHRKRKQRINELYVASSLTEHHNMYKDTVIEDLYGQIQCSSILALSQLLFFDRVPYALSQQYLSILILSLITGLQKRGDKLYSPASHLTVAHRHIYEHLVVFFECFANLKSPIGPQRNGNYINMLHLYQNIAKQQAWRRLWTMRNDETLRLHLIKSNLLHQELLKKQYRQNYIDRPVPLAFSKLNFTKQDTFNNQIDLFGFTYSSFLNDLGSSNSMNSHDHQAPQSILRRDPNPSPTPSSSFSLSDLSIVNIPTLRHLDANPELRRGLWSQLSMKEQEFYKLIFHHAHSASSWFLSSGVSVCDHVSAIASTSPIILKEILTQYSQGRALSLISTYINFITTLLSPHTDPISGLGGPNHSFLNPLNLSTLPISSVIHHNISVQHGPFSPLSASIAPLIKFGVDILTFLQSPLILDRLPSLFGVVVAILEPISQWNPLPVDFYPIFFGLTKQFGENKFEDMTQLLSASRIRSQCDDFFSNHFSNQSNAPMVALQGLNSTALMEQVVANTTRRGVIGIWIFLYQLTELHHQVVNIYDTMRNELIELSNRESKAKKKKDKDTSFNEESYFELCLQHIIGLIEEVVSKLLYFISISRAPHPTPPYNPPQSRLQKQLGGSSSMCTTRRMNSVNDDDDDDDDDSDIFSSDSENQNNVRNTKLPSSSKGSNKRNHNPPVSKFSHQDQSSGQLSQTIPYNDPFVKLVNQHTVSCVNQNLLTKNLMSLNNSYSSDVFFLHKILPLHEDDIGYSVNSLLSNGLSVEDLSMAGGQTASNVMNNEIDSFIQGMIEQRRRAITDSQSTISTVTVKRHSCFRNLKQDQSLSNSPDNNSSSSPLIKSERNYPASSSLKRENQHTFIPKQEKE